MGPKRILIDAAFKSTYTTNRLFHESWLQVIQERTLRGFKHVSPPTGTEKIKIMSSDCKRVSSQNAQVDFVSIFVVVVCCCCCFLLFLWGGFGCCCLFVVFLLLFFLGGVISEHVAWVHHGCVVVCCPVGVMTETTVRGYCDVNPLPSLDSASLA